MSQLRLGQVAEVLGVSVDTVRRWVDAGRLPAMRTGSGHRMVEGAELARFIASDHDGIEGLRVQSTRNHLPGIVTRVVRDGVAAQVELQAGPFRMVSLM